MKLRKTWIAAMVIALVATTGIGAYAAGPEIKDTVDNILVETQIYAEGEMPAILDGAVMFDVEIINDEADANLDAYAEEMPDISDGEEFAVDPLDVNLFIYAEGEMPDIPDGVTFMDEEVAEE